MLKAILQWLATLFAPKPVPELGRNEPCHCGSGRKYKRCCLEKDAARLRAERDTAATVAGSSIGGRATVANQKLPRPNQPMHRANEYRPPKGR
jgi:hypothetical protein